MLDLTSIYVDLILSGINLYIIDRKNEKSKNGLNGVSHGIRGYNFLGVLGLDIIHVDLILSGINLYIIDRKNRKNEKSKNGLNGVWHGIRGV